MELAEYAELQQIKLSLITDISDLSFSDNIQSIKEKLRLLEQKLPSYELKNKVGVNELPC